MHVQSSSYNERVRVYCFRHLSVSTPNKLNQGDDIKHYLDDLYSRV